MAKSPVDEMGAEQWPQMLLVLLIIAIGYNLFNYFRKNKKAEIATAFSDFFPGIVRFVKSRLFIGMILLVALGLLYEPLGFIATCFIFLVSYGFLLGLKKPIPLIISSLVIMFLLYIIFAVLLSVMLPRGYVYFLREIAYFLEGIFLFIRR
jgi:hypothetical protein